LKPGGYLIILEITNNDVIRVGFSMSGLPGWWLGQEDGRELSPCISTAEWHRLLLGSGFSGVDSHTPEVDIVPRPMTVIVSQAIDDQFAILSDATLSRKTSIGEDQWDLVLIGGRTMKTIPLIEQMSKLVEPSGVQITCFDSIECIDKSKLSSRSAILLLTELDKPVFQDISEKTMSGMKRLFETQRTILWVTQGRRVEEPYMNMSIGFGRTLVLEVPDLRLQFLDLETSEKPVASRLLETLSRLYLSDSWEKQGKFNNVLWSHEEELAYENGRLVVSRRYFSKPLNDRFNASRRCQRNECSAFTINNAIRWFQTRIDL
jgi:hybrid polyketide synthase / nonribosomal peptide synthetase ACE1